MGVRILYRKALSASGIYHFEYFLFTEIGSFLLYVLFDAFSHAVLSLYLGSVALCCTFLQLFVSYLYNAERLKCSDST